MDEQSENIAAEEPREISSSVEGFTPIFDRVDKKYGNATARVYGAIWRYCRMKEGVCRASLQNIAEKAGVDRRSAIRCIKKLEDDGLIIDTTPDSKYTPHVYRDGGVVNMSSKIVIEYGGVLAEGVTPSHSPVTPSHSPSDTVSLKDTIKTQSKIHTTESESSNSASSHGNGSGKSAREVILEKRGGKSEKTVEEAANEKVDKIIELNTPPEKKRAALKIREIFEAETGLNIGDQWENKRSRWYLFDEWLLDKFKAGEEVGVWLDWYFTTHNKNKQRKEVAGFLSPDLIKTRWNLAFMPDEVEVDNTTLIMQQHTKIY